MTLPVESVCISHAPVKPSHWAVPRFINQTDQRGLKMPLSQTRLTKVAVLLKKTTRSAIAAQPVLLGRRS